MKKALRIILLVVFIGIFVYSGWNLGHLLPGCPPAGADGQRPAEAAGGGGRLL